MNDKRMTVRPPLAPIAESVKCKEQYEKLQAEFAELDGLKVRDVDAFIHDGDPVVTLDEFNRRAEAYMQRRDAHNTEFAADIETRDHVRANIKELYRQLDADDVKSQKHVSEKYIALWIAVCREEKKFKDIQDAADAAFAEIAKHTRPSTRVVEDERL